MEEKQKELAKAKVSKIQEYLSVFDNDEGKKVLLDLMEKGHILKPTTGLNDRESIINEGKREMVLYIMDMVTYDVETIMKLVSNKDNNTNNDQGDRNEDEQLFNFFND